ncbi:hypothetical protein [Hymenobacter terricola]|uniref:hypothetical protein n=1 Tax=Hymenobacter terricola TaxID=2819236 RepID=UPI001B30D50B|nr:hypothetical protein [Hymenobacter terricola]
MNYSLSLLKTHADCDAVLAFCTSKSGLLNYHNNQTDHRAENLTASATGLASELTGLNAFITAMTPVIPTLPAGKDRDKQENDLRVKTDRRDTLVARQGQTGPEALVESQLEQNLVDLQLPAVQELVDLVTAHRATLAS